MPSSRGQVPPPSARGSLAYLQARLYSSRCVRPIYARIPTFIPSSTRSRGRRANSSRTAQAEVGHLVARYPWIEQINEDAHIQARIHDCRMTVHEGGKVHHFILFFLNHVHLPSNHNLGHLWRGDIIVMRLGVSKYIGEVINLRNDDCQRVDWLVSMFVSKAKQGRTGRLPARLCLIRQT